MYVQEPSRGRTPRLVKAGRPPASLSISVRAVQATTGLRWTRCHGAGEVGPRRGNRESGGGNPSESTWPSHRKGPRTINLRSALRLLLALIYLAAGVFHLLIPDTFLTITPHWVPFPRDVILGTGLCEIAGAIGLLSYRLRRTAGIALAAYAFCVFPANIKHAIDSLPTGHPGWLYHGPRLVFQPVFVWWALLAGDVVDWPFTRPRKIVRRQLFSGNAN